MIKITTLILKWVGTFFHFSFSSMKINDQFISEFVSFNFTECAFRFGYRSTRCFGRLTKMDTAA